MFGCVFNCQISVHYIQDVHQLPLVLVYALHLDVIQGIERNYNASSLLDIPLKLLFVRQFDLEESVDKVLTGRVLV